MRAKIVFLVLLLAIPVLYGFSFYWSSIQYWGFDGVTRAKEWVSPDGRMSLQSQLPNMSTAVDYWPTASTRPTQDSLSELTLQRYQWDALGMERMSWSAMVDQTDGGAYRFGVERSGTGQFRPMLFCFENVTPGAAVCPLKIDVTGVWVLVNGVYWPMGGPP